MIMQKMFLLYHKRYVLFQLYINWAPMIMLRSNSNDFSQNYLVCMLISVGYIGYLDFSFKWDIPIIVQFYSLIELVNQFYYWVYLCNLCTWFRYVEKESASFPNWLDAKCIIILFRVRSCNNGVRCMSFCILIVRRLHRVRYLFSATSIGVW